MHSSGLSVTQAPYGLAFAIEDLIAARRWAEERNLRVSIVLDCTMDGAEVEELLIVAPPGAKRRTMTLWRTQDGVCAQIPAGSPHHFSGMQELLTQIRPVKRSAPWRRRLGLA